ncbi:hypothetical protein [Aerosakkonema funiforme]|uniref:hypothetical protein n=1 Tax=Aerosakkonema funiforme TaxID=1246630 RepID=UPI001687AC88|nr:hypothetical protein [Aerosakkonema funiforme]
MLCRDLIICLRETAFHLAPKQPADCLVNLPCGCSDPGKHQQCEGCPHLEGCLSRCKTRRS